MSIIKKRFLAIVLIILVFIQFPVSSFASNSVPNAVLASSDSVVRIVTEYTQGVATGSGFVVATVNKQILIATNYHVVDENPIKISVYVGKDDHVGAHIVCYSKQQDLCVLQLDEYVNIHPLALNKESIARGEEIYAIGFPGSADYLSDTIAQSSEEATITNGIVSATREYSIQSYGSPVAIVQINADINPGNSGGPLLDRNGYVVGINTYGVTDAQGIYGAVAVSELIALLKDNNLPINYAKTNSGTFSTALWIVSGLVSVALICGVVIILLRRHHKTGRIREITLTDFIARRGSGLSSRDAVSLLLPIAYQIQNRHQGGALHLQISPDKIIIKDGKAELTEPSVIQTPELIPGYSAPELYHAGPIKASADVYSLAAVLYYTITAIAPEKSETRSDDILPFPSTIYDETIKEILETAMSLNQDQRFPSIQAFIDTIQPYNKGAFIVDLGASQAIPEKKLPSSSKKKPNWSVVIPCSIVAALLLAYGISLAIAAAYVSKEDYISAKKCLLVPAVTELHSPNFVAYIDAGVARENRDFFTATYRYEKLKGYRNSEDLYYASLKDYVFRLVNENDFADAMMACDKLSVDRPAEGSALKQDVRFREGCYTLYELRAYTGAEATFLALSKEGYTKAQDMLLETYYVWGSALAEKEDYLASYKKFQQCKGYKDTDDLLELLEEGLYLYGIEYYQNQNYTEAAKYFDCVSGYERSDDYLTLISVHRSNYVTKLDIEKLTKLIGFEDAGSLIFKDDAAFYFLEGGTFKTSGFFIKFYEKGEYWYAEWPGAWNWSGHWNFKDGVFYVGEKARFNAVATSKNSIVIYMISNGRTFTLIRQ